VKYTIIDWCIDVADTGKCLMCKGKTLEYMGRYEVQCYSCGRWMDLYEFGKSEGDWMHLSTSNLTIESFRSHRRIDEKKRKKTKPSTVQSYVASKFEEELSSTPKSMEDFGSFSDEV